MIIFLTSSPGGHTWEHPVKPVPLDESNRFIDNLKKFWKKDARALFIAADPDNYDNNDLMAGIFEKNIPMSGLSLSKMDICDSRNPEIGRELRDNYDFVILSGGHVPTENKFINKIKLKDSLKDYEGILMTISAGSMNCAGEVYAMPELEGESVDVNYKRYLEGLSLTDIQVIPHYQYLKEQSIDGSRMIEDIAAGDSFGKKYYMLNDGSYIMIKDGVTTLYGEAYTLSDGVITKICDNDSSIII